MQRALIGGAIAVLLAFGTAGLAAAAPSPNGTGQPGASCGASNALSSPAGFGTGGFANAEKHYAGSEGTPSLANGNAHAVSQYDVACFQLSSNH